MFRIAACLWAASGALLAQSPDSQTLQAILLEMRQLRKELTELTAAGQQVQILLYRAQLQDEAVKRASTRYDQVSFKLKDAERGRTESGAALKAAEEKLPIVQNPAERKGIEDLMGEMKRRVAMWTTDENSYRPVEVQAGIDLRTEQAKLRELHQRLERLEGRLGQK